MKIGANVLQGGVTSQFSVQKIRAADRLKILIANNCAIKKFNRD